MVITHPRPHAHGSKDFADTGHHGARRADRLDLLDAGRGPGAASPHGATADPSSCPARTSWPGWMPVSIGGDRGPVAPPRVCRGIHRSNLPGPAPRGGRSGWSHPALGRFPSSATPAVVPPSAWARCPQFTPLHRPRRRTVRRIVLAGSHHWWRWVAGVVVLVVVAFLGAAWYLSGRIYSGPLAPPPSPTHRPSTSTGRLCHRRTRDARQGPPRRWELRRPCVLRDGLGRWAGQPATRSSSTTSTARCASWRACSARSATPPGCATGTPCATPNATRASPCTSGSGRPLSACHGAALPS